MIAAKQVGSFRGLMFRRATDCPVFIVVKRPARRVKVHTWFVRFPIEVFWLDVMGEVMHHAILQPFQSAAPKCRADVRVVLEAPVGMLKEGDLVSLPGLGVVKIELKKRKEVSV